MAPPVTRHEVTRFAPSPTGYLHLGHAHAALFAAARGGGRCLLRLEDIDPARCRPAFAAAIIEDLHWLGLSWPEPVRVQSDHLTDYARALDRLRARGLLYPCFCSRADIAAAAAAPHTAPDGGTIYPGTCRALSPDLRARRLAAGEPHAWRLDMARARAAAPGPLTAYVSGQGDLPCQPERFGDVVLGRRDAPASYHLCVTHDDALQGVTLVTRAEDLRPATDLHRLLQALFGWPAPAYAYHPVLTDAAGRRLSKRDRAATLRDLRDAGATPAQVRALAGFPDRPPHLVTHGDTARPLD